MAETTTFTPGPWIAHAMNHARGELWLQVSQQLPDGSRRGPICRPASPAESFRSGALAEISHMATPEENQIANARLMAAAPEMLEALQAVRNYGGKGETDSGISVSALVERAIRKALTPTTAECPLTTL